MGQGVRIPPVVEIVWQKLSPLKTCNSTSIIHQKQPYVNGQFCAFYKTVGETYSLKPLRNLIDSLTALVKSGKLYYIEGMLRQLCRKHNVNPLQ